MNSFLSADRTDISSDLVQINIVTDSEEVKPQDMLSIGISPLDVELNNLVEYLQFRIDNLCVF